jgi:hypothetical protein
MVEGHLSPAQRLACGIRAVPGASSTLAATQAAFRFLNNPRVSLRALAQPLLEAGREAVTTDCQRYVLAVHDWSLVRFRRHHRKQDRLPCAHGAWQEGYELFASLLVSDRAGEPLAPAALSLHAADGVHCSRSFQVREALSVLDELDPAMTFVERQSLSKPVVHIVDAEADSAAHYRQWSQSSGRQYLVRADDRLVECEGRERRCSDLAAQCRQDGCFQRTREVQYHGRKAEQWVAEAPVRLTRPGQRNRPGKSRARVPGPPLPLRLVVAEVRSPEGPLWATWFLLTNVSAEVDAATIALWYYWRWRIESYFKLLKSAGLDLEQWGQETAAAVARRLLVASMACALVWKLARSERPEADEARRFLVRLSGRQMKHGQSFTQPALLAGVWMLLTMLHTLEHHDLDDLKRIADVILPGTRAGPAS